MQRSGFSSLWVLWLVSSISIGIYAVSVWLARANVWLLESGGAYLFAGLVGLMAFLNQKEISRKVAALEEQARMTQPSST